jgi:nucleoside-diphosphate-sugar epimerase
MRVLIIGSGYIGLPLGRELAAQGHQVCALRRFWTPEAVSLAQGLTPLSADVSQPETLAPLPPRYDWVVFCVATSGGAAEDYRRVYLEGSRHVADWLRATPPQQLVYTSSTSVYGQTDGSLVDETSAIDPGVETGEILAATEKVWLDEAQAGAIPSVLLRLAGIYGPGRGYWFKEYLKGTARMNGRGDRILNMIHRDDVVGAVIRSLVAAPSGEIFNVVDNEPATQFTFFEWLSNRLGGSLPPAAPAGAESLRKRGASNKRVANQKIRNQLNYQLKFPTFREGYEVEIQRLNLVNPLETKSSR